jgi:hypothetical protein
VKPLVCHPVVRLPVVLIAATAWVGLSSHCVLGAIERSATKATMSCHGSAPNDHAPVKEKRDGVECCKVVRATLLSPAKSAGSPDELVFAPYKYVVSFLLLPEAAEQKCALERDTGPPDADSFAEAVLQRSILAHAPPFFLS